VRLRYEKGEEMRFLSHLDVARALERALRASELPVAFTEGFSPRVRLSYGPPLPVGIMGQEEVLDLELCERVGLRRLVVSLNERLPRGLHVREAEYVPFSTPSPSAVPLEAIYTAVPSPALPLTHERVASAVAALRASDSFPVTRVTPKGEKTVDLKTALLEISAVPGTQPVMVKLALRTDGAGIAPRPALAALLALDDEASHHLRITRIGFRQVAERPARAAAGA
jgi:radical SAM-linked protein